jgi:uncharacterized protein YjiS (DUF1127 family)
MEASINTVRRVQAQAGHALITILIELGVSAWKAIARHAAAYADRRRQADVRNELRRLSDRSLKDIGLERSEIEGLFR